MARVEPMTPEAFGAALDAGPYAWPGGYPQFFVMADGESLSFPAAIAERERIDSELRDSTYADSSWSPVAVAINWEDSTLVCCHTGARIESAYAEDSDHDDSTNN